MFESAASVDYFKSFLDVHRAISIDRDLAVDGSDSR